MNTNYISEEKSIQNFNDPLFDTILFTPIAEAMVDPLYCMGLTPNMITIISTLFTLATVYFLSINSVNTAVACYVFGYILDCVDGKIARKYNMMSNFGMVLDLTSDFISNIIIVGYILYYNNNINVLYLIILLYFFSYMLTFSYGMIEAVASYKSTNSDNFYKRKYDLLKKESPDNLLYDFYLLLIKSTYDKYRDYFPTYNYTKLSNSLHYIKEFGAGNYLIFMAIIIYIVFTPGKI
jgi:phosphatidylglycerophosphate synthase